MQPEIIVDYQNVVGEGPLWHSKEKKLYWVDIMTGRIFRYDPVTGEHSQFSQGPIVGGFTIQKDGSLLLFMEGPSVAELRNGKLSYLIKDLPGSSDFRFNDVIADPAGRVFCGTMPIDSSKAMDDGVTGKLYRLDTDGSIQVVVDRVSLPSTLKVTAWSTDQQGDFEEIMGIKNTELGLEGVQFHPEAILTQAGLALLNNFITEFK